MDAVAERYVLRALEDPDAGVREHAVRLAERIIARGASDELWQALTKRLDDPDVRVRYQLAFTLGEMADRDVTDAMLKLVRKDIELPWMHVAALTSLSDGAGDVFSRLVETPGFGSSAPEQALLADLLRVIGHRNKGRELLAALRFLQRTRPPAEAFPYLGAFAEGLQRADVPLELFQPQVQPVLDSALREVRNHSAAEAVRVRAIELIGLVSPSSETVAVLLSLIGPEQPHAVTSKALAALGQLDEPDIARRLLDRWPTFTPAIRRQVLPVLLARPERAAALVEAIKAGRVQRSELTPTQVAGLRAHRNIDVRTAAAAMFPSPTDSDRRAIIQRYQPSLDMAASSARGQTTYAARCAVCHQRGTDGTSIGPSVESLSVLSPDEILTHMIDPNRTVDARYRLYDIETTDGGTVSGIVEDETQGSVTVRPPFGGSQTLPRSRITRMQPLERSFMPEGLEEGLSLQDMADLLAYLKRTN